jgi:organic radical activating enzyme
MKQRTQLSKDTLDQYKDAVKNKQVHDRISTNKLIGQISKLGHVFNDESVKHFPVEENPFPWLFIDTTLRCNFSCNQCYNPVMPRPDIDVDSFEQVIKKLPNPVEVRLLGGEPSLHKDFHRIVDIVLDNGHSVYISTNGYNLGKNKEFASKLKEQSKKGSMKIHIDFSCGLSEEMAEIIHADRNSVKQKIAALEMATEVGLSRVTVSMVVTRSINEHLMGDLFKLADMYPKCIREIAYRSQGNVGRYLKDKDGNDLAPYTTNEWLHLMLQSGLATTEDLSNVIMSGFIAGDKCKGKNCCFHYKKKHGLYVSWIDFLSNTCWMRGQLREKDGTVLPEVEYMFESLQVNDINKTLITMKNI